ncbi:MAG: type I glyceraldehyde-3-phosphate dehydrogenase [Candidatus Staskawiczbacteria bacterium]|nr:type I glyceraldehyde-3-phosphate dehydrogenase [Candidatus Staskawiczbacteria bacterium]
MPIKVAINGFGRIGRQTFRIILEKHPLLEVVAINDLTDNKTLAHLLKYDSVYGILDKKVSFSENSILIDGKDFQVLAEKDPLKLPWKKLKADIVLECTGVFTDGEGARKHLKAGAKKVIISAPCKEKTTPGFVLGVNEDKYNSKEVDVMDMGSCTTNCLAPMAKVLNDNFKIKNGFMTTVHSYTNDQRILDLPHKDLRRARAAGLNLIPTSTGAAKAIGKIIPELEGKLDGIAIRIPTPAVSVLDLIVEVEKEATKEEVNEAFLTAASSENFKGILRVEKSPLVSTDFVGDTYSAIVDFKETMAKGNLIKAMGWYDNEWGYASRLAEFAEFVGKKI